MFTERQTEEQIFRKEFAQVMIPTAQLSLYEKDGWELVESVNGSSTIRKRLAPPESPP